jgi:hypothetical protein
VQRNKLFFEGQATASRRQTSGLAAVIGPYEQGTDGIIQSV